MIITRRSLTTGKLHQRDINVTSEQLSCWQMGHRLIQDAMPNLTPDEREFIMTGIIPEEWDNLFPDDDDDCDCIDGHNANCPKAPL